MGKGERHHRRHSFTSTPKASNSLALTRLCQEKKKADDVQEFQVSRVQTRKKGKRAKLLSSPLTSRCGWVYDAEV
jgi:hypothetical protein